MKKFLPLLALILAVLFALVPTTTSAAIYRQGVVYVIYNEQGDPDILDKTDLNSNDVPDAIEDMATQLNAVRELLHDVYHYPDPLNSSRFKNVTSIEIDLMERRSKHVTGKASSGVRKKSKHNPGERAIRIRVANTVDSRKNSTVTHEYFHLVQFGATYFRNKWFLEGMARWSQDAVLKIKNYPDGKNVPHLLSSLAEREKIFKGSYNIAKKLWYPLAISMKDKAKIPDSLMQKYKYVDGTPVFHDNIFYGANVMRDVILLMKSKEHLAAANYSSRKEWRRKGQRDERNNKIIFDCVREVYNSKQ